ncbi:MAG: CCA tRNA nucleotidyltransferase, partial [Waddliaceae bacterium]
ELKKMAEYPHFEQAIIELHQLGLLAVIFPLLKPVGMEEIKRRISSYAAFPKECPPILYLMELFPEASLEEQVELCHYLKVSNHNIKLVELTDLVRLGKADEWEDVDWARYYAKPNAQLCLEVVSARLSPEERDFFLKKLLERKKRLEGHIARIASNKPLVTSADLKGEGIAPSKRMGDLLQEAERISINEDLHQKEQVMAILKKSPKWQQ